MQPLVRQYSWVVSDRRRMRRMEADRPTTDEWWVRVSMCSVLLFPGRGPEAMYAWTAVPVVRRVWGDGALFLCLLDAGASRTGSL